MSQILVTGEAKIRDIQGPVVANSGVITALDGAASQYVRGDGTLADFPTSSGGGSSVSYYLNSSVSQGTIGGVAYRELSKDPIIGAGTDIAISSNGYVANYITDVNDPDVILVPGGNFNCEFYFSVSNDTGNPTTYAELYKYDGTTFTLLGTSAGVPESINQGTTIAPYYFAIPVATAALSVTDRLAIRIYVNVDSRTVTLHTENGHLCQVVTTLSKGMVSLNNLTDQSQYLATGTSGTNFAIVSTGDTHTFNLPVASATNTGKLSSTDWSTFNGKVPYTGATASVDLGLNNLTANNVFGETSLNIKVLPSGSIFSTGYSTLSSLAGKFTMAQEATSGNLKAFTFDFSAWAANTTRTYTLPDLSGTLALLEGTQTFSGAKTFSGLASFTNTSGINLQYGAYINKGNTPLAFSSGTTNIYSDATTNNIVIRDNSSIAKLEFNNSTQTYTFPAATGTLALTSNLSSYLPLTGGTLTGALNGTTATFGGNLNITINTSGDINYLALNDLSWNIGDRKSISWYQSATKLSSIDAYFEAGLNVGFRFSTYLNANFLQDAFTLSSAGAGVFSSTLIANNNISAIRSGSSLTTLGQSRYLNLNDYVGNSNARMEIGFGYSAATGVTNVPAIIGFLTTQASDLGKGDLYFATRDVTTDTAPTVRLTIASSGAATFTGALSGTSATFSGGVSADVGSAIPSIQVKNVSTDAPFIGFYRGGTLRNTLQLLTDGSFRLTDASLVANAGLTMGALSGTSATFSSSVTIQSGNALTLNNSVNSASGSIICPGGGSLALRSYGNDMIYLNENADIRFSTSSTERMRITSGGNVLIGTTSGSNKFSVSVGGVVSDLYVNSSGGIGSYNFGTGAMYSNAGILTNTNPSDKRLKENIEEISWGLTEILKLKPVSYYWKDDKINQGVQFGFIAQEVQEVMPEAIKEFGTDVKYLGLEKDAIYATLVKAIQELEARIKQLENK